MKIEFLMCGSPNDAFFSQAAMFRLSLDAMDEMHRAARLVLCVGSPDAPTKLPRRWEKAFERIELHWADRTEYAKLGDGAQGHQLYRLLSSNADLSIICDADTMLLKPLPFDFLEDMRRVPAVAGVIAHFGPPLVPFSGSPPSLAEDLPDLWEKLACAILPGKLPLETPYTLATDGSAGPAFYINHAFLAAPPWMLKELFLVQEEIRPLVRNILDNYFYDQITVAMAIETSRLPSKQLPMRFNFPNDRIADLRYPEELQNVVLMHYLRTTIFDRHFIFAEEAEFHNFLSLDTAGSDRLFQDHVRALTSGKYPFPHMAQC